jgi:hypothetical protein
MVAKDDRRQITTPPPCFPRLFCGFRHGIRGQPALEFREEGGNGSILGPLCQMFFHETDSDGADFGAGIAAGMFEQRQANGNADMVAGLFLIGADTFVEPLNLLLEFSHLLKGSGANFLIGTAWHGSLRRDGTIPR